MLLTECYSGDQTNKNRTGGAWGRGEVVIGFWWGNLREGDHLEDPGVDGRIILKWIFEKWGEGMH